MNDLVLIFALAPVAFGIVLAFAIGIVALKPARPNFSEAEMPDWDVRP
jgi:hypothetical protein